MRIWVWIIAAISISVSLLRKKGVSFEHYIWVLLPIDMYGISFAGAVIKPYMLFSVCLLMRMLLKGNLKLQLRSQWVLAGGILSVLLLVINLANNQGFASAKAALLVLLVWFCTVIYISNCGGSTFTDIPKVLVATGVGYGVVFILGYLLTVMGVELPEVIASERNQSGFFLNFSNMHQGKLVFISRLRGFTIDPNTMIGTFAFCSITCILKITKGEGKLLEWIGLLISGVCVLLSGSRMGLICFLFLLFFSIIVGYKSATPKIRSIMIFSGLCMTVICISLCITTNVIGVVSDAISSRYGNRSGLSDEYGRFTLWEDAVEVLMGKNPLFGIGMGQMQHYTPTNRACHNTWLEMICSSGLIIGGMLVLYFFLLMLTALHRSINRRNAKNQGIMWCIILGSIVVIVSLVSVDNMTYSYLWFGTAMIAVIMSDFNSIAEL